MRSRNCVGISAVPKPAIASAPESLLTLHVMVRHEQLRWVSLQQLDVARPEAMTDEALLGLARSVYPDASSRELRRELDYLEDHGLLRIERRSDFWHLKLTWQGVDVVEYTSECPAGIGRPFVPD